MGMDWLNGLLGGQSNMIPPGQPIPTGAPYGGAPGYGAPPQQGGPIPGTPPAYGSFGPPMGTAPGAGPEQVGWGGAPSGGIMGSMPSAPGAATAGADPRVTALEARVEELRRDVDSIALFARTLLTLLQDKQLVTPEQFSEAHRKLDMLDGKLDDRIAPGR